MLVQISKTREQRSKESMFNAYVALISAKVPKHPTPRPSKEKFPYFTNMHSNPCNFHTHISLPNTCKRVKDTKV
ncbi:hypothetical protein KFK09_015085 [Dendrobium nobile]|uniref:Uncharacterized protein n=1 Tax=Dendrobium nobile TaxID=94219 RepID=A0A8T3B3I0_DENNO|nr:hypothetical protein KFK09_015085 [Dendrobium nobile]